MGITEDIACFEQILSELVVKYEQYFLGMEKREPLQLLAEVERAARGYQNVYIVNTMMKFKYNALVARLNSYKQYWNRTNRLIEEGKYSRDRFKMEMHEKMQRERTRPRAGKEVAGAGAEIENLFQQYIAARKACNLPVKNVTQEMIASVVERQKP